MKIYLIAILLISLTGCTSFAKSVISTQDRTTRNLCEMLNLYKDNNGLLTHDFAREMARELEFRNKHTGL